MRRMLTGFFGAVTEAWAELHIHKTRVLLSLVGVAVAVAALTSVVGLGSLVQQATTESYERSSGRPATLYVGAYSEMGQPPPVAVVDAAFREVVERYRIGYSGSINPTGQTVQFVDGAQQVDSTAVDVDYAVMHRLKLISGDWFTEQDE